MAPPRKIEATNTFHLNFITTDMPGKILYTEVTIRRGITSDQAKVFRLDLCDHPLYRSLWEYCRSNPPRVRDSDRKN